MTPKRWIGTWPGGRIREVADKRIWYIRRRLGHGARIEVAVADSEACALAEWALFQRDPAAYRPPRAKAAEAHADDGSGAVRLDGDTVDAFLEWAQIRVERGELTADYKNQTLAPYLGAWAEALRGADLHRVGLEGLRRALKTWKTARHKRITALKAFARWAREEKDPPRLRRRDDPTLDLKTPPIIPAKSVRAKGYALRVVEALYRELPSQAARDMICLRAKLGMHDTEIARIASGEAVLRRVGDPSGIEGVIVFQHLKKGKQHAVSCDAQTFAAAERLQARGSAVSRNAMKVMVDRACVRAELKTGTPNRVKGKPTGHDTIHPGQLRHSFATWATTVGQEVHAQNQRGVDLAKVAEHMGHLSKRTTAFFYVGDRIPILIRLPLRLEHEKDPIPLGLSQAARETASSR